MVVEISVTVILVKSSNPERSGGSTLRKRRVTDVRSVGRPRSVPNMPGRSAAAAAHSVNGSGVSTHSWHSIYALAAMEPALEELLHRFLGGPPIPFPRRVPFFASQ
jgi:hypothetical protein